MEHVENPQKTDALPAAGEAPLTRPVAAAVEYIETHYPEGLSLDTLSEQCFVSKFHLSHEFRRQVGLSVHQYILDRRLRAARELLLRGEAPSRVAPRCGFGDYPGFYRAFVARYGVGPRAFVAGAQAGPPPEPGGN